MSKIFLFLILSSVSLTAAARAELGSGYYSAYGPLLVNISLTSPCSLLDRYTATMTQSCSLGNGIMNVRITIGSRDPNIKTAEAILTPEGNVGVQGSKTYTGDFATDIMIKDIQLNITGPGMGSLRVLVNSIDNNGKKIEMRGGADSIFFLLTQDGDVLVNQSGYFELERAKLTDDLQTGRINKSKYDEEWNKMTGFGHTYVCAQIKCL